MNGNDYKQIEKLFNAKFEALDKRMDDIINSFNAYKEVTKQYIDERNQDQQKLIDSHCFRLREAEKEIIELQPSKNFYGKIKDFSVGAIIVLGGAVITMASYIYEHLTNK